jgi:hypothetical protein
MIPDVVARLRRDFGLPAEPARRGPVPLNRFFEEMSRPQVSHCTLPDLTLGLVVEHLRSEGIAIDPEGELDGKLDGFLFLAGDMAWAYVRGDGANPLGRRRFTAAHELGHAVLHRAKLGRYRADAIVEEAAEPTDQLEREANRFAAELLMPVEICEARADELRDEHGCCPRDVLEYTLSAELLVSREAMRYRLKNLGIGDE